MFRLLFNSHQIVRRNINCRSINCRRSLMADRSDIQTLIAGLSVESVPFVQSVVVVCSVCCCRSFSLLLSFIQSVVVVCSVCCCRLFSLLLSFVQYVVVVCSVCCCRLFSMLLLSFVQSVVIVVVQSVVVVCCSHTSHTYTQSRISHIHRCTQSALKQTNPCTQSVIPHTYINKVQCHIRIALHNVQCNTLNCSIHLYNAICIMQFVQFACKENSFKMSLNINIPYTSLYTSLYNAHYKSICFKIQRHIHIDVRKVEYMRKIWSNKKFTLRSKLHFYNSNVLPTLLYSPTIQPYCTYGNRGN